MPKALEEKLLRQGKEKGFFGKRLMAYVYGTLRKTGWKPHREKRMQEAYRALKRK